METLSILPALLEDRMGETRLEPPHHGRFTSRWRCEITVPKATKENHTPHCCTDYPCHVTLWVYCGMTDVGTSGPGQPGWALEPADELRYLQPSRYSPSRVRVADDWCSQPSFSGISTVDPGQDKSLGQLG